MGKLSVGGQAVIDFGQPAGGVPGVRRCSGGEA